jgi:hypothetical protein
VRTAGMCADSGKRSESSSADAFTSCDDFIFLACIQIVGDLRCCFLQNVAVFSSVVITEPSEGFIVGT